MEFDRQCSTERRHDPLTVMDGVNRIVSVRSGGEAGRGAGLLGRKVANGTAPPLAMEAWEGAVSFLASKDGRCYLPFPSAFSEFIRVLPVTRVTVLVSLAGQDYWVTGRRVVRAGDCSGREAQLPPDSERRRRKACGRAGPCQVTVDGPHASYGDRSLK